MVALNKFLAACWAGALAAFAGGAVVAAPALEPCWLPGYGHQAICGRLSRALDPAAPQGRSIDIHYAVLPALARNKHPDPVFVFAGGPGQSAIDLAGSWSRLLVRLGNRRDIVLIDQRGTGRSAKLACPDIAPTAAMADTLAPAAQLKRIEACRVSLEALPHGDLRHYGTAVAVQDAEAVRLSLGAPLINLVGGSYGTRAALEYQRQFPKAVRRVVLDGVAPPDMALPAAFSLDSQAALEALFRACEADTRGCASRHPKLRQGWRELLAGLPRQVTVAHPLTGVAESVLLERETVLGLARAPLYAPALAAALPQALSEAASGRFEALFGLASALQGGARAGALAEGMHYAVICTEDVPRLRAGADAPGSEFGNVFAGRYERICANWPRGEVPAGFYEVVAAPVPTLVLSGGADPATPPRHGERVSRALGAKARHVVVREAGHGVMGLPCMRDVLYRFIAAQTEAEAQQVPADCAEALPRPGAYVPPGARVSATGGRP